MWSSMASVRPGIDADEEGVGGDEIGVCQGFGDAMLDALVGRVPEEISTEEVPGLDLGLFERGDDPGALRPDSGRMVIT